MSLLSKLLGSKTVEKAAKDILSGILSNTQPEQSAESRPEAPTEAPANQAQYDSPSGLSWGENMPAEENQFNYSGTYEQYFEHVFTEDFPSYRFEKSYIDDNGKHRIIYTLYSGDEKALVIELMPESSEAVRIRNRCIRTGIPYLRFYYDHEGWWNTRSYVTGRIRGAING